MTQTGLKLNKLSRYTSGDVETIVKYEIRGKLFGASNRTRNKIIK